METALRRISELVEQIQDKKPEVAKWIEHSIGDELSGKPQKAIEIGNMLERLIKEIKRRTRIIELFPTIESAQRLISSLLIAQDEQWLVVNKYLNMERLELWENNHLKTVYEELQFAEVS